MSSEMVRWGGLAGVAAGVMFVLAGILSVIAPSHRILGSFSYYLIEVVIVVAFALTLVAIVGLHALQSGRYGPYGPVGSLITFIGYAIVLVSGHIITLAGGEPIYIVGFQGGWVAFLGSILLGTMTLNARVLPWWCGVLLIVGFPLDAILDLGVGGESIVLAIVWGLIGYALLSRRGTVEQPSRVR
jgi:hypothetical protein